MSPQSRLCEPLRPQCQERRLMGTPPGEPLLQGDPDAAWRAPASPFPLCPCTCSARRDRPPPAEPRVRESPPQVGPASCGAPVLFLGASSREWWGRGRHASHPKQCLRVAIRWLACLLPASPQTGCSAVLRFELSPHPLPSGNPGYPGIQQPWFAMCWLPVLCRTVQVQVTPASLPRQQHPAPGMGFPGLQPASCLIGSAGVR